MYLIGLSKTFNIEIVLFLTSSGLRSIETAVSCQSSTTLGLFYPVRNMVTYGTCCIILLFSLCDTDSRCSQLRKAVSFKEYGKSVVGASRVSPTNIGTLVKDRSTYLTYKSATGPSNVPVTFMCPALCQGGNIEQGCALQGGSAAASKCKYILDLQSHICMFIDASQAYTSIGFPTNGSACCRYSLRPVNSKTERPYLSR